MAHDDPLQEASDPSTVPERLRELAEDRDKVVQRATWRNPSLPEDVWRTALLWGKPEAWSNSMTPIYLLTWTPHENDPRTLEAGARWATWSLWKESERCSLEGKALIAAKVQEWWATSESAENMMIFFGYWAKAKGNGSVEHREVVRLLVLCVRTAPNLTANDLQALEFLEAWGRGGKDRRKKDASLAFHHVVKEVCHFALNPENAAWNAIRTTVEAVATYKKRTKYEEEEAKAEHQRLLADLIRREMPLPPLAK